MAGFKHRYIIVKIISKDLENKKIDSDITLGIKSFIYNSLKANFGENILGMVDYFEVVESYEALGIVLLRCNLSIYKYICYTICSTGKLKDKNVKFNILGVSGILKKAKLKILEIEQSK